MFWDQGVAGSLPDCVTQAGNPVLPTKQDKVVFCHLVFLCARLKRCPGLPLADILNSLSWSEMPQFWYNSKFLQEISIFEAFLFL